MSDVHLYNTLDGGECDSVNGVMQLTDGPETLYYLAMFGGNNNDPGVGESRKQWWANYYFEDKNRKLRSRTQYILKNSPLTSATLPLIKEAVLADIAFTVDIGLVTENIVSVSVPRLNFVNIRIESQLGVFDFPIAIERL